MKIKIQFRAATLKFFEKISPRRDIRLKYFLQELIKNHFAVCKMPPAQKNAKPRNRN